MRKSPRDQKFKPKVNSRDVVWSICVSISVTITDIWTKFGTEHKYHTINTPEWPNWHKLKIQDGGGRHLELQKNINNSGLDTDIYTKVYGKMHHGHAEMTRLPKVNGEVNSWDVIWSISVLISVTIAYIWTKFYTELKHRTIDMTECSKFTWLENPRWWRPPSWISENVNNSELDREVFAQNLVGRCITAMRRWHMAKSRNWNFFAWRRYYDE